MPDRLKHSRGQIVREVDAEQFQPRECMPSALLGGVVQTAADEGQSLYLKSMLSNSVKFMSSLITRAVQLSTPVTCELPSAHEDGCASRASTRHVGKVVVVVFLRRPCNSHKELEDVQHRQYILLLATSFSAMHQYISLCTACMARKCAS